MNLPNDDVTQDLPPPPTEPSDESTDRDQVGRSGPESAGVGLAPDETHETRSSETADYRPPSPGWVGSIIAGRYARST